MVIRLYTAHVIDSAIMMSRTCTHAHTHARMRLQQSIFLVVILESFADLRSDSAIGTATKTKDKPLIVSCGLTMILSATASLHAATAYRHCIPVLLPP